MNSVQIRIQANLCEFEPASVSTRGRHLMKMMVALMMLVIMLIVMLMVPVALTMSGIKLCQELGRRWWNQEWLSGH